MNTAGPEHPRTGDHLSLEPASPRARAWLFALVVALPLLLVATVELIGERGDSPGIAWHAIGGVAVFCLLLWAALAALLRRHRLQLDGEGLELATTFYRRRFAITGLDLAAARVVDLGERPEYRPMLRTNGLSIPGFHSGWYRLRNGNRALVATAGGQRLLWIPTTAGHDLVLQPGDPRALLERLREMAGRDGRR